MKRLDRIAFGLWGDPTSGVIHIDIVELMRTEWYFALGYDFRRLTARDALRQLREARIPGVIVAHMNGIPARFEARQ